MGLSRRSIVCAKEVGWAHQARKIILMATDGFLHFAGDGKVRQRTVLCLNGET